MVGKRGVQPKPIMDRLWPKVQIGEPDECWPWQGAKVEGYGLIGRSRAEGPALTHRVVLEDKLGRPITPGMVARHTCDNPPCCNPSHLVEGTYSQNTRDMVERGRKRARRNVLTEDDVRAIRASSESAEVWAERFGVIPATIRAVRSGKNWKHVL